MPELPEVETVRRDLEARVIGRRIVACHVAPDAPRLVQLITPDEFCRQLAGRTIAGLRRRGKYLIVDLDDGRAWVIHRRMSGNVLYRTAGDPPDDYTRAAFSLDDGHELRWTDLRKVRAEKDLSLRIPAFRDLVAELAAALRGVSKDEIFGEDLAQHRRTLRTRNATGVVLTVLTLVAATTALVAINFGRAATEQREIAEDGQRAAVARQLEAQSRESLSRDPRTALRLAVAAQDVHPDQESKANLNQALTATSYAGTFPGQSSGDRQGFFPDGTAFVTSGGGQVTIWNVQTSPPVKLASFAAPGFISIWDRRPPNAPKG